MTAGGGRSRDRWMHDSGVPVRSGQSNHAVAPMSAIYRPDRESKSLSLSNRIGDGQRGPGQERLISSYPSWQIGPIPPAASSIFFSPSSFLDARLAITTKTNMMDSLGPHPSFLSFPNDVIAPCSPLPILMTRRRAPAILKNTKQEAER